MSQNLFSTSVKSSLGASFFTNKVFLSVVTQHPRLPKDNLLLPAPETLETTQVGGFKYLRDHTQSEGGQIRGPAGSGRLWEVIKNEKSQFICCTSRVYTTG